MQHANHCICWNGACKLAIWCGEFRLDGSYSCFLRRSSALQTHFWPGRGANTAIQTGYRAAQICYQALQKHQGGEALHLDFEAHKLAYSSYVKRLADIEVGARSKIPPLPTEEQIVNRSAEEARALLKERAGNSLPRLARSYTQFAQPFQPNLRRIHRCIDTLPDHFVSSSDLSLPCPTSGLKVPCFPLSLNSKLNLVLPGCFSPKILV